MKEIGGYIELNTFTGRMLHDDGLKLNSGRNCLAYLITAKQIKRIVMPIYMCDSCDKVLKEMGVKVRYYRIGHDFKPLSVNWGEDEWLYIVNYYGQLDNQYLASLGKHTIVDNAQAYYREPIQGVDTIYSCRKFFGVPDGAILYTDSLVEYELSRSESHESMEHLLGRYECSANEYYQVYIKNEKRFENEPLKHMSRLTENLLHAIDYDFCRKRRNSNFTYLHENLKSNNLLKIHFDDGAFMYPLYTERAPEIRMKLQKLRIYIPVLWPSVFTTCNPGETEYNMALNILPLPCDHRYNEEDMEYLYRKVIKYMKVDER